MGSSIHISQKSKVRNHHQKAEQEIILVSGKYIHDFIIELNFTLNGIKQTIYKDFLPLFQQYVKGDNLKYFAPANFKKFIIKNGTIYWGKDEDVIFPSDILINLNESRKDSGEILYII